MTDCPAHGGMASSLHGFPLGASGGDSGIQRLFSCRSCMVASTFIAVRCCVSHGPVTVRCGGTCSFERYGHKGAPELCRLEMALFLLQQTWRGMGEAEPSDQLAGPSLASDLGHILRDCGSCF